MARNKYPEITEQRILDASLKLFLEKGYEHTTIQDIIDELGDLTKGAIYHHFKSKSDIIEAVMNQLYRSEERRVGKECSEPLSHSHPPPFPAIDRKSTRLNSSHRL